MRQAWCYPGYPLICPEYLFHVPHHLSESPSLLFSSPSSPFIHHLHSSPPPFSLPLLRSQSTNKPRQIAKQREGGGSMKKEEQHRASRCPSCRFSDGPSPPSLFGGGCALGLMLNDRHSPHGNSFKSLLAQKCHRAEVARSLRRNSPLGCRLSCRSLP